MKGTLFLFILFSFFAMRTLKAEDFLSWKELEKRFSTVSPHPKILSHVQCFYEQYENADFKLKGPKSEEFFDRCYSSPTIQLQSKRFISVVDYTVPSDEKRMFIIDRATGDILSMAVAHGRYQAGFFNQKMDLNKNTIRDIKYFSNTINSMASSSGFFIGGQDFIADDFGRSLVIHGIERDINDNACERDVVIHQHRLMTKSRAFMLSSGCLMIAPSLIDQTIELLKGISDENMHLTSGGALLFIYGPREKAWAPSTCPGNFRL